METIQPTGSFTKSDSVGCVEKQSKKSSRWSIGGLFRRNKKKFNDSESSSSSEDAGNKRYLKRPYSLRKGRSRTRKDFTEHGRSRYTLGHTSDIVRFEHRICPDNAECSVAKFNQTSKAHTKLSNFRQYNDISINDGRECKGRIDKSSNEHLRVESSSDDLSESSGQRKSAKASLRDGSTSLRSRASRTERYRKRVLRHEKSSKDNCNGQSSETSETRLNEKVFSNNQWTADVVYYESSDYDTKYTAKLKSASSSPMQSPKAKHKYALNKNSSPTTSLNLVPTHPRVGTAVFSWDPSYSHTKPVVDSKQTQFSVNTIPQKLAKSRNSILFRQPPSSRSMLAKNEPNLNNIMITSLHTENKVQTLPPPPPPPRDPQRKVIFCCNNRENHYSNLNNPVNKGEQLNSGYPEFGSSDSAFRRIHLAPEYNQKNIASNNDVSQIIEESNKCTTPSLAYQRPVVANPECNTINKYEDMALNTQSGSVLIQEPNQYNYLTDQPRSRKPIQIAYKPNQLANEHYLIDNSDSQLGPINDHYQEAQSSIFTTSDEVLSSENFGFLEGQKISERMYFSDDCSNKKLSNLPNDTAFNRVRFPSSFGDEHDVYQPKNMNMTKGTDQSGSVSRCSDQRYILKLPDSDRETLNEMSLPLDTIISEQTIHNNLSPYSVESKLSPDSRPINVSLTTQTSIDTKLLTPSKFENSDERNENIKRYKKNLNSLEDALNELETIYNSLKLDDEQYFENGNNSQIEHNRVLCDYSNWNNEVYSEGIQSELNSCFGQSPSPYSENLVSPTKMTNCRRPDTPNTLTDDMAYRRLIKKEKIPSHEKEVISRAGSFLLVSPTLSPPPFFEIANPLAVDKEPDTTYDDVVYRNIQHTNNTLKILDPQPLFGIPLLPVTQAPNSSYLHSNSKESFRPTFKPKKYPDIVADDLAFRNLRKDKYKEPVTKAKVDQDKSKKCVIGSALLIPNKANLKIGHKDYTASPINRRLSYNNNIEEDLNQLQCSSMMIDSSKVHGFVPRVQYAKPVILESMFQGNERCDEENSSTVSQISDAEISWSLPLKTFTGSAMTQDSMQENSDKLPYSNSSKRSKTFSIEDIDRKSDCQTSVNDTYKCQSLFFLKDANDKKSLLSKQTSDNLQKLNEFEVLSSKISRSDCKEHDSGKINCIKESSVPQSQLNYHDLTKLTTCDIVKHNELTLIEDRKSGNDQPETNYGTVGVEKEQSLQINKSSDLYLGECTGEYENDNFIENQFSTVHNSFMASPNHFLMYETDHAENFPADALNQYEECATDELIPLPCSGKVGTLSNTNTSTYSKESGFLKVSNIPISGSFEEDEDQAGQTRKTQCAVISDKGMEKPF